MKFFTALAVLLLLSSSSLDAMDPHVFERMAKLRFVRFNSFGEVDDLHQYYKNVSKLRLSDLSSRSIELPIEIVLDKKNEIERNGGKRFLVRTIETEEGSDRAKEGYNMQLEINGNIWVCLIFHFHTPDRIKRIFTCEEWDVLSIKMNKPEWKEHCYHDPKLDYGCYAYKEKESTKYWVYTEPCGPFEPEAMMSVPYQQTTIYDLLPHYAQKYFAFAAQKYAEQQRNAQSSSSSH